MRPLDPADEAAAGTLAHALESMDETTFLVLAMLHVDRMTIEETAQALGLETSAVEAIACSARARLAARVHDRQEHRAA